MNLFGSVQQGQVCCYYQAELGKGEAKAGTYTGCPCSASCRAGPAWDQLLQQAAAKASSQVPCLFPTTGDQNVCNKSQSFHSPGKTDWSVVMPVAQGYQDKQTSSLAFRLLSPLFWGQQFSSCLSSPVFSCFADHHLLPSLFLEQCQS